jgi:hypothetical protein
LRGLLRRGSTLKKETLVEPQVRTKVLLRDLMQRRRLFWSNDWKQYKAQQETWEAQMEMVMLTLSHERAKAKETLNTAKRKKLLEKTIEEHREKIEEHRAKGSKKKLKKPHTHPQPHDAPHTHPSPQCHDEPHTHPSPQCHDYSHETSWNAAEDSHAQQQQREEEHAKRVEERADWEEEMPVEEERELTLHDLLDQSGVFRQNQQLQMKMMLNCPKVPKFAESLPQEVGQSIRTACCLFLHMPIS